MAIEIRELLIRTFVGSRGNEEDDAAEDYDSDEEKGEARREQRETTADSILADISKLLQQTQER